MREANARGKQLNLTDAELAFYDALETNDSAVKVLGDETLRAIARELVATVRANVTIDWTVVPSENSICLISRCASPKPRLTRSRAEPFGAKASPRLPLTVR